MKYKQVAKNYTLIEDNNDVLLLMEELRKRTGKKIPLLKVPEDKGCCVIPFTLFEKNSYYLYLFFRTKNEDDPGNGAVIVKDFAWDLDIDEMQTPLSFTFFIPAFGEDIALSLPLEVCKHLDNIFKQQNNGMYCGVTISPDGNTYVCYSKNETLYNKKYKN